MEARISKTVSERPVGVPETSTLLDIRGVASWLNISVSTARRWVESGHIPQPLRLSAQIHRWRVSDIEAWLASRQTDQVADMPDEPSEESLS